MSELREARWAVVSERGCEATGLEHAAAAQLLRRLAAEKLGGLCIITNDAARRLPAHSGVTSEPSNPSTAAASGGRNNHHGNSQRRSSSSAAAAPARRRRSTKTTS